MEKKFRQMLIAFLALVRYIGKGTAVPCPYIA
jgi:hypothetical protein